MGHAALHVHAAIQIIDLPDNLTLVTSDGTKFSGGTFLIRPLVKHQIEGAGYAKILYAEPQFRAAQALLEQVGSRDIEQLSAGPLFASRAGPVGWLKTLSTLTGERASCDDPRLRLVMTRLADNPGAMSIAAVASSINLSRSQLRVIARKQLGLPLSTWLLWRKLELSGRALALGATLRAAALEGGFADQAHFSRTMRRMFGITGHQAATVLRLNKLSEEQAKFDYSRGP